MAYYVFRIVVSGRVVVFDLVSDEDLTVAKSKAEMKQMLWNLK